MFNQLLDIIIVVLYVVALDQHLQAFALVIRMSVKLINCILEVELLVGKIMGQDKTKYANKIKMNWINKNLLNYIGSRNQIIYKKTNVIKNNCFSPVLSSKYLS